MKRLIFILCAVAVVIAVCGTAKSDTADIDDYDFVISDTPAYVVSASLPFSRGVNFTTWFEAPAPRAIPFTKFTEQDFINAKSIGVDVIRLPINLHSMTGGAPGYTLDPLFLQFLDSAVNWAEKHEIYLILDNHSFDPVANTDSNIGNILIPVWTQMAQHYRNRSDYILYEVLNEPHGIDAAEWGEIQGRVIAAIRAVDSRHRIVVGGIDYNSIDALSKLPQYSDAQIIYTFHFYDPYLFTHQGETWGAPPNLKTLKGLPFPSDAHAIPAIPVDLKGTWIEDSVKISYQQAATVQAMAQQLDKAALFSQERGDVPLLCGEFGVFIPNSLPADRVRWYQAATKLLENRNMVRTSWDYFGGFGIFKTDKGGSFSSDLNVDVVKAMGFTPPAQKPAEIIRDAFTLFDNYPSSLVDFNHWNCNLDLYYQNGAKYAISWGNSDQYGSFSFNFKQGIDWEYLQSQGYALTFRARVDKPARFDVRFVDREDASSIPWRIRTTLNIAADGQWNTHRIPLSEMREHGAWVSAAGEWRGPEGKFSWANTASLAFVAEDNDLHGITILFDTIKLEP